MLSDSGISILDVYRLSIGPSLQYTTGSLQIGSLLRNLLIQIPFHQDNRIIIEMRGEFASQKKENLTDIAVTSGLGGYQTGKTNESIQKVFSKIKKSGGIVIGESVWPFNPESDIICKTDINSPENKSSIRLHLISKHDKILLQAEFFTDDYGRIAGTGIQNRQIKPLEPAFRDLLHVNRILSEQEISLTHLILSLEAERIDQKAEVIKERLRYAWKIMETSLNNGLSRSNSTTNPGKYQANQLLNLYQENLFSSTRFSPDTGKASWNAYAVGEEIINNQIIISAPTCTGAGILPAVFQSLKTKFRLSDEQIVDGLLTAAYFEIILHEGLVHPSTKSLKINDLTRSLIMTVSGSLAVLGFELPIIESAAAIGFIHSLDISRNQNNSFSSAIPLLNGLYAAIAFQIIDMAQVIGESKPLSLNKVIQEYQGSNLFSS